MDHWFMFEELFPVLINIIIVILAALVPTTQSAHPQFEACKPRSCGKGLNISYLFYIPHVQKSYCGYPDYEISCKDEESFIQMSDQDYLIKNIFYTNHSLLVVNAKALQTDCLAPLHNFTLNGTPFEFSPAHIDLFFFYNCISFPNFGFPLNCVSNDTSNHSFVMFAHYREMGYLNNYSVACKSSVSAPVDMDGGKSFGTQGEKGYLKYLKTGFILEWSESNCSECEGSGGRCGFYENEFVCFCPDGRRPQSCIGDGSSFNLRRRLVIGCSAIGAGIIVIIIVRLFCLRCKFTSHNLLVFSEKQTNDDHAVQTFFKNYGSLTPKRYSFSDVKKMTDSFKEKLGQGGYGSVYKGKLLDCKLVAVKVLSEFKGNGEEFINEVASISRTSHVNIVTLIGFSFEGRKRALIYEFMPNGSLEKFIYVEKALKAHPTLGWERLYNIAIGIARGLEYLHRGCNTRILHFDIKPHNILLDQDFCPKISDFGLATLCPNKESTISMLGARGTVGYIAPEVFSRNFGGVSHKSDVYSYGMMVLEMVGGRKNIDVGVDHTSEIYFPHWIYKRLELDEDLGLQGLITRVEEETARKMTLVGLWCIQTDQSKRPSMTKVVEMLEGSLNSLQIPPKPFIYSPSRSPEGPPTQCESSLTMSMS